LSVGFKEEAELYLNKFKWGKSFLALNKELLETYANCKTSSEVVAAQNAYLTRDQEVQHQNPRGEISYLNVTCFEKPPAFS